MHTVNFEKARFNMVEQQVRPWEVLDQRVLDIMAAIPRDEYVPEPYRTLGYADVNIPLEGEQLMMTPREEGRLLQALSLESGDKVLEIGTGSGYLTALLAGLAGQVVSVEIMPSLATSAGTKLADHGVGNVAVSMGDGVKGWPQEAPYDAIAVTGSVSVLGNEFREQLKIGGRLFVIVGNPPVMEARLITRVAEHDWYADSLFETLIPALKGAEAPPRFVF